MCDSIETDIYGAAEGSIREKLMVTAAIPAIECMKERWGRCSPNMHTPRNIRKPVNSLTREVLELKRKYFGQEGELYKKREALIKPIQDEIYTAIQDLANEKKIDVVKDRSADPSLIYMSSKLDVSDQVLQKLGAK